MLCRLKQRIHDLLNFQRNVWYFSQHYQSNFKYFQFGQFLLKHTLNNFVRDYNILYYNTVMDTAEIFAHHMLFSYNLFTFKCLFPPVQSIYILQPFVYNLNTLYNTHNR